MIFHLQQSFSSFVRTSSFHLEITNNQFDSIKEVQASTRSTGCSRCSRHLNLWERSRSLLPSFFMLSFHRIRGNKPIKWLYTSCLTLVLVLSWIWTCARIRSMMFWLKKKTAAARGRLYSVKSLSKTIKDLFRHVETRKCIEFVEQLGNFFACLSRATRVARLSRTLNARGMSSRGLLE